MKSLKFFLISFLSIWVLIYLAFIFVLPNVVDLNNYMPQITKAVQDSTGFRVNLSGLKIKTAWDISANVLVDKADLKYTDGQKFAQINGLKIRLSLLPMFLGKFEPSSIEADKILANIDMRKQETGNSKQKIAIKLNLSPKMPYISAKKYRISVLNKGANYTFKGEDLDISDFVLDKKIKIKTKGYLILNGRKQISYKIKITSDCFPKNASGGDKNLDFTKVLEDLYKYNFQTNITCELRIKNGKNVDGKVNFENISFVLAGKTFPPSSLNLNFVGDKIKINSNLYTDSNSKISVNGYISNAKHKSLNLNVETDKTNLNNGVFIVNNLSKIFGKNDLQDISANGDLKANFSIKSDFKNVESSGFLKIRNANITNHAHKISLSAVNADVDFSKNSVAIKNASAKLNSQPITIKGNIDKNAYANISILADNLQLKSVLLASGNSKILDENDVLGGMVDFKAVLIGRLNKTSPKINVLVKNIKLKNKKSKAMVSAVKVIANSTEKGQDKNQKYDENLKIVNMRVLMPNVSAISAPELNLGVSGKNIEIIKSYLYFDNIKTTLSGKISNIDKSARLNALIVDIPNQISVPIKGYANSNILIKGKLELNGDLYNPVVKGNFVLPVIRIPGMMLTAKNSVLTLGKTSFISCPQLQIANSIMNIEAQLDNDFSKGISAKNVNFVADNIDLNILTPVFANLPKGSGIPFVITNGKSKIAKFKAGGLNSSNITSDIRLKNNILYLDNLRADAYFGKIGGNINYDLNNRKASLSLQGRGLSANPAIIGLTGRDDDINGKLDFDSNVSFVGYSKSEILNNLKGSTNFIISNGKMGVLGKFEHLLYAQNIVSNSVFKATLNVIAKAITAKNTGVYKFMKGKITFSNGWANVLWIKTSGPSMSLYLTGRYYMPGNTASLTILGRISDDVVRILGPIGEFSMNKAISYIPKLGEITEFLAGQFTTNPTYENTSMIPSLTPGSEFKTKEFKVIIDGDVQKQSSVKSFKWLARPSINQAQSQSQVDSSPSPSFKKEPPPIPDFVKNLPDLKKED